MEKKQQKEFVVIKCPHCKTVLKFAKEPRNRRVYALCKNCNKKIEVIVK